MKKLCVAGFLTLCAATLSAQMTTVTATVVDTDSTVWAGGKWSISFNPAQGYPNIASYTINGAPLVPSITNQNGVLDGAGNLSISVYDSSQISPIRSGWVLQVCPNASSQCGSYIFSTAGSSMNISSNLTAAIPAPRFVAKSGTYGYADIEATISITIGSEYYNVISLTKRCYNGTSWAVCSGSGSGTITGQTPTCAPLASGATALTGPSHLCESGGVTVGSQPLTALQIAGVGIASQYQSGGGNNGVANCASLGPGACRADPGYGITEQNSFTNMIPNIPSPFYFQDLRQGMTQNFYHNFPYTRGATFSATASANVNDCLMDAPYTGAPTPLYQCGQDYFSDTAPGFSGNATVLPVGSITWQVGSGRQITYTALGAGIREGISTQLNHNGQGDTADYFYLFNHGGARSAADEGEENAFASTEDTSQFRETCVTGCTTGSQSISGTPTSFGGAQGVRCCVIDTTVGPTANTITNLGAGLATGLEAVTFGTPVTASGFWGTLAANVQPQSTDVGHYPFGTVVTFSVNATSGTPVVTSGPTDPNKFCFASQFDDPIIVTGVTGTGPYSITGLVRHAHASGSVVMQGAMCNIGMEIVANTPSGANPNRYLIDIIGCISTTVCEATFFRLGSGANTPFIANTGNFNPTIYASGTTTGLSSNGTTVYATGVTGLPLTWYKGNVIFSGASDSALNIICTGVAFPTNVYTSFTCTNAGLTGTHTATTSTFMPSTTTAALNVVNLWPKAEALDVQTYNSTTCTLINLAPVCVRGDFTLAPNQIAFNAGDSLTQTNDEAGEFTGVKSSLSAQNPFALFRGIIAQYGGNAAQGGGGSVIDNAGLELINAQSNLIYTDNSGQYVPPNGIDMTGSYADFVVTNEGPSNGDSLDFIGLTTNQKNNPNYLFTLSSTTAQSGALMLDTVIPFLGDRNILEPGLLGLGGTAGGVQFNTNVNGAVFSDRISFSPVTPPTCTVTQGPGTGTLADATYGYRIAVRNNASGGPGIPGTECTGAVSNGGVNSVKITWPRAVGADVTYYIFGRTPSGELQMTTVGSTVLAFVDNGSITPSGAIPVTDLTRGFVDQAAKLCANSSGTAFAPCLTAQPSAASSFAIGFPETNTAGSLIDKVAGATVAGQLAVFTNTTGRIGGLAAARKGTFVCTAAGTITITNSNELIASDVIISLNTAGGTITTAPAMKTVTSGTGFTVLCGASDTSTYNYNILD